MKKLLIVLVGLVILSEGCVVENSCDYNSDDKNANYVCKDANTSRVCLADGFWDKQEEVCVYGCDEETGKCSCSDECVNECNDDGSCKPRNGCQNGANNDGTCKCPGECDKGCTDVGACKQRDDCTNGYNPDGTCRCPEECQNGCTEVGACKQRADCTNGYNPDGSCKCPDKCQNGCDETGSKCICSVSCIDGSTCDENIGKCTCIEQCKFGCDEYGACLDVCEYVKCEGKNEQCQAIEKEDKYEAVCVDLCKDKECTGDTICKMGECVFWDENNNHLHDQYETAVKQGEDCRKYSDCDSKPKEGDGFCDSFIGYKCSTKCTDDSQCVDDGEYHYVCRPDGRCAPDSFVTVWDIPADNKQLRIPTSKATACNFDIDWGDDSKSVACVKESKDDTINCKELGDNTLIDDGSLLHEYQKMDSYTVKIKGVYDNFSWDNFFNIIPGNEQLTYFSIDSSPSKLYKIIAFGLVGVSTHAFATSNLKEISTIDIPDASKLSDLSYAFCQSNFNQNIENWDMSNVTDIRGMFYKAVNFNQPLDHWDTSSMIWMGAKPEDYFFFPGQFLHNGAFSGASAFNQNLEHWDTSNVVSMTNLFYKASSFNGTINSWNTSNVKYLHGTFEEASTFNQPLDNWDTSNVTDMAKIFSNAMEFNQPIGSWKTSNVENMEFMFSGAEAFNQPIGNWNTSKVTNMRYMFNGATSFDQTIGNWDTRWVENMSYMFSNAKAFNHSINKWSVYNVTNMNNMFEGATSFNQPLDDWYPSSVTQMSEMFSGATSFDQDLSSWQLNGKTDYGVDVTDIFKDTKLAKESSNIYCKIFNAWKKWISTEVTCAGMGKEDCSCE
ncbi:MAG: BspA family leucine-rich repeat surface protein [Proteobacteria bacterium]|nr:BspA family leucine-rich repeat surface protein [Pseudomonadota bacterium]